ncbi:MAG: tetratricopeptide repeat protein [Gemmatimonadota bacterium]
MEPTDFIGAEACAECHDEQYRAWAGSTHGRAGGAPSPDVVIAPFNGRPIRFADATVIPRVRGGRYEFLVRQKSFPDTVYTVSGVIGGGHMIGGGTQGFLTRWEDGTERFLPWDWSRGASVWFCNTGSRKNQGWVPISPEMRLADCGDWPPLRPIGTVARFANCQECHGSQIRTEFNPQARAYLTSYTTLQINCESCHGPGREHVLRARSAAASAAASAAESAPSAASMTSAAGPSDLAMPSLTWLDKDASLEVCFRCHILKDVVTEGYLPGEDLRAYYAWKFPVLGDQPYFADGRVRTFAYQGNHLASACYLEGPMDCVSCHEPHAQGYWDTNREPLASPFDDGQCTSCHPSKDLNLRQHTRHPPESDGARCVNCHMPYLQHPEVGKAIPFARSDHTIAIPRPVFDADLGITGACASCHEDMKPLQLQDAVRRWWGELKPHRPLVEGQIKELRARSAREAAAILLHPEEDDPLLQFQALSRLLVGYLPPDTALLDAEATDRLRELAQGPDLEVRALALATLHWIGGDMPETRALLVRALKTAADPYALTGRWVLALGFLGDHYRKKGNVLRSEAAYRKALQIRPGDERIEENLGLLYSQAGRPQDAVRVFQESLSANPDRPLVWVNLGIALAAQGDAAGARAAYENAIRQNPHEALAYFNLGNLLQRSERFEEAAAAYRKAVAADPGLGRAHFELARTLIRLGRYAEALPEARRAVEFLPDHAPSAQMLADLERAAAGRQNP